MHLTIDDLCQSGSVAKFKIKPALKQELYVRNSLVSSPRAAVLLTHGMGSHSGRNDIWAADLNKEEISVFSFDLPGHGRSRTGDWLFEDFKELTDALHLMYQQASTYCQSHDIPLFLFGHSMGGLITADFIIRYQPRVTGVILSAPALDPGEIVKPWMIVMAGWLKKLIPGLPILQIPADKLSKDTDVVVKYQQDPLVYQGKINVNTGYELLSSMRFVMKHVEEFRSPVLILQGEDDKIVRPEISRQFYDRLEVEDKTWKSYPGMYHEVLRDIGNEKVKSDIIQWLDERISSAHGIK